MVTKIMPVFHAGLTNRDQRSAADGTKRKERQKLTFKEVLTRTLARVTKR